MDNQRQSNPWVPEEERNCNKSSLISAAKLLLMGYGAYCIAKNLYLFAKRKFSKDLPIHEDM